MPYRTHTEKPVKPKPPVTTPLRVPDGREEVGWMVVTKLSSSNAPAPDQKMGYNPVTGHFRILQKDWLVQIMAEFSIGKPTAFSLLRDASAHGLVSVDTTAGLRKTVLSWYLPKLVDSTGDAVDSQSPGPGEMYRGPLGFWPDSEQFNQTLTSRSIVLMEEGLDDVPSESFLEIYKRWKHEIEQKDPGRVRGRALRLSHGP